MSDWVDIANLDDIPADSGLGFEHAGKLYALFQVGDGVACVDGLCRHQGSHLARGSVEGTELTCPRRGCLRWRFDIITGASSPGRGIGGRAYPSRVEGGRVLVALPSG